MFQIEPSHQSNPDTARNKGRKSRTKGRERKRSVTTVVVVVVASGRTANKNGGGAQGFCHG